jgi:hypothetical protein
MDTTQVQAWPQAGQFEGFSSRRLPSPRFLNL